MNQLPRFVLAVCGLLLCVAGGLLLTSRQAAAPSAVGANCADPCDLSRIAWVGDILLGDAAQPYIDVHGYAWPLEFVQPLLEADFVIGNAEGPITARRGQYFPTQRLHYNADPKAAAALARAGFGALGLSNNHALDRGPEGLADTIQNLRAVGIQPFGAGMDGAEAAAPLLVSTPYGTAAVLGFSEPWRFGAVAGPGQFGTVPFSEEVIAHGAALARASGARWTIAYVHWGENYAAVTSRQRRVAGMFSEEGYDLVVGHHSHVAQEVDLVGGMPVLYSLGNFAFGTPGRFSGQFPGYGLVAHTSFGPHGLEEITLSCILTDNKQTNYQPRPCDHEQTRKVMQALGPHVNPDDGKVRLAR